MYKGGNARNNMVFLGTYEWLCRLEGTLGGCEETLRDKAVVRSCWALCSKWALCFWSY